MSDKRSLTRTFAFMALAVLAGLGLAAWIYANNGSTGNGSAGRAGEEISCATTDEEIASLKSLVSGEIAAFRVSDKPSNLADLAFNDKDGNPMSLADFRGKTVLLNLWATWCAPCREEMPSLDRLQADMGNDQFVVVPVNIDLNGVEKAKSFYEEINLQSLGFYADSTMGIFNTLKKQSLAFGMPTTLLINDKSCALGVLNGPAHWDSEDAKKLIQATLD